MGENMPTVDVTRITVRKENLWGWKIWTLVPLKHPLPLYHTREVPAPPHVNTHPRMKTGKVT